MLCMCPHFLNTSPAPQLANTTGSIQAPGTPHAVVTVENTLLAGIFIYTAATFSRSIECIRLNLAGLTHSNEEDGAHEYNELALVIEHIDRMDSVTAAQREEVRVEVGLLLQSEGVVYIDDRGEWHKSHEWASEAQKAPHRRSGNKTGKKSEASSNIGPRGAGIRKRTPAARGRPSSRRTASETQAIAGAASTAGSTRSSPPPTADAVPPSDPLEAKDAFLATCLKWWWPLHMARSGDVE